MSMRQTSNHRVTVIFYQIIAFWALVNWAVVNWALGKMDQNGTKMPNWSKKRQWANCLIGQMGQMSKTRLKGQTGKLGQMGLKGSLVSPFPYRCLFSLHVSFIMQQSIEYPGGRGRDGAAI